MNLATDPRTRATVRQVVSWLVDGNYYAIEYYTGGIQLTADQLEQAIRDYGRKLVYPPEQAYDAIDAIEIIGSDPRSCSVRFDLWTEEEGRSDLSLECTLRDTGKPTLDVEIDNVHVL